VYGTKGTIVRDKMCISGLGERWMDIPVAADSSHDYMPEIDHVLDCIIKSKPTLVTPYEAYQTCMAGYMPKNLLRKIKYCLFRMMQV